MKIGQYLFTTFFSRLSVPGPTVHGGKVTFYRMVERIEAPDQVVVKEPIVDINDHPLLNVLNGRQRVEGFCTM